MVASKDFLKEENIDGYLVSAEMKQVWKCEIDILSKFIEVCQKYNLRYYLAGGTLLGCIRHKGFIPWDDDIDIDMPREDYEILKKIGPTEFTGDFFFQTPLTDVNYFRPHLQIRNSKTTAIVEHEKGLDFNQGIFIDIFPLDAAPKNKILRWIHSKIVYAMNGFGYAGIMINPKKNDSLLKIIAHYIAVPFFKVIDYKRYFLIFEKVVSFFNDDKTLMIGEISFDYREKCIWKRECFDETIMLPFEYMHVSCPQGYDQILKTTFDDYMTPMQAPSYHGNIIFDVDRSYTESIK